MRNLTLALTLGMALIAILLTFEAHNLKAENANLKEKVSIINANLTEKLGIVMLETSNLRENLSEQIINNDILKEERDFYKNTQKVVVLPKRINIELGKYNLKFNDKCWLGEQYVGCTSHGRDITLVDNRSIDDIIVTCNHEFIHNQIKVLDSQFEEQVTKQLEDKVIIPECEALRKELEG